MKINVYVLTFFLALSACSPQNESNNNQPTATFSAEFLSTPVESTGASSFSFGTEIQKGATIATKQLVFLKDAASSEPADSTVSLESADGAFYLVSATQCNRELKKASDKCYTNIKFMKSNEVGSYEGVLRVGDLEFALSATVVGPAPQVAALKFYEGSLEVSSANFGELNPNASSAKTFTVKNEGTAAALITTSLDNPSFIKNSDTCHNRTIAASKTCSIKITLKADAAAPTEDVLKEAILTANDVSLALEGTFKGTPAVVTLADLRILDGANEVESIDFGLVAQSQNLSKTLTVKNVGTATSAAVNAVFVGDGKLSLSPNSCSTLAPNKVCYLKINLTAGSGQTVNEVLSGTLSILDGAKSVSVAAEVQGVPAKFADLRVFDGTQETSSFSFGEVSGSSSTYKIFSVKNLGDAPTAGSPSVSISGDGLSITSNTCSSSLRVGGTCSIKVLMLASAATTEDVEKTGELTVDSKLVDLSYTIKGEEPKAPSLAFYEGAAVVTEDIDLGLVEENKLVYKILSVKNTGNGPSALLSASLVGDGFTLTSNACNKVLQPNQSCSFRINFTAGEAPLADEPKLADLSVGDLNLTISATRKGGPPKAPSLVLYDGSEVASTYEYGFVDPNVNVHKIFMLKNEGTAAASAPSVAVEGSGFVLATNTCYAGVAVGGSCQIRVLFSSGSGSLEEEVKTGSLKVNISGSLPEGASPPAPIEVALSATVNPLASDPEIYAVVSGDVVESLNYGPVSASADLTKLVTFHNLGGPMPSSETATLVGDSAFKISANSCTNTKLGRNERCSVNVRLSAVDQELEGKSSVLSYGGVSVALSGYLFTNERACNASELSSIEGGALEGTATWTGTEYVCQVTACEGVSSVYGNECVAPLVNAASESFRTRHDRDVQLEVSGGKSPLSYSVVSSIGSSVDSSGLYNPGSLAPGSSVVSEVIKVVDAVGQEVEISSLVYSEILVSSSFDGLYEGQTLQLSASGGYLEESGSYSFEASEGSIDSSGLFSAPASVDAETPVTIVVKDNESPENEAQKVISVYQALQASPLSISVEPNGSQVVSAVGGNGNYELVFASGSSSLGSYIDGLTYHAGSNGGSEELRLRSVGLDGEVSISASVVTNCDFEGGTLEHGQSVTRYKVSDPGFVGKTCSQVAQVRQCLNGVVSGEATENSCSVSSRPLVMQLNLSNISSVYCPPCPPPAICKITICTYTPSALTLNIAAKAGYPNPVVDWGDGTTKNAPPYTKTYPQSSGQPPMPIVKISGEFTRGNLNNSLTPGVLYSLTQWGTNAYVNMQNFFKDEFTFQMNNTYDMPNFNSVVDTSYMFAGVYNIYNNKPFYADTSSVTNMSYMFYNSYMPFTSLPLNTSSVSAMTSMFQYSSMSPNLTSWCVPGIASEPANFASFAAGNKPLWGTCPQTCDLHGIKIPEGGNIVAYATPVNAACTSAENRETRTCTNGVLSGSFQYVGCVSALP